MASLREQIYKSLVRMDDPTMLSMPRLTEPVVSTVIQALEGQVDMTWVRNLPRRTLLQYTYESKGDQGKTTSAWHCCIAGHPRPPAILQQRGYIRRKGSIEDPDKHVIREGLQASRDTGTSNTVIDLWVDNQITPRSLSGGPSS